MLGKAFFKIHSKITQICPWAGFSLSGIIGSKEYFFKRGARAEEIKALFGIDQDLDAEHIARKITVNDYKNAMARELVRHSGLKRLGDRIRFHGEERLVTLHQQNMPAIVMFSHIGPPFFSGAGLLQLRIPFLTLFKGRAHFDFPKVITMLKSTGTASQSYIYLKNAYDYLKNGGLVLLALDGSVGESETPIQLLGRQYYLRKGISMLHRLTGAPVIPTSGVWSSRGRYIDYHVHEPLVVPDGCSKKPKDFDTVFSTMAAAWLESVIHANPEAIRLSRLRKYLALPVF